MRGGVSDTMNKKLPPGLVILWKILRGMAPIFALLLFTAAIILLHHNLRQYHIREIVKALSVSVRTYPAAESMPR